MAKLFINLEKLKDEYKSTYLSYWNKDNHISFTQWLKKEKGIIFIKK